MTSSAVSTSSTSSDVRDPPAFEGDYRRLKREHALGFETVVREKLAPACDAHANDPTMPWSASSRVRSVASAAGIVEMTWSFASPDGRATFELVDVDGQLRCRWRRVGDHDVFEKP